jgi:hypothetical protein
MDGHYIRTVMDAHYIRTVMDAHGWSLYKDGHYIRTVMDAHERLVNVEWMMGGRMVDAQPTLKDAGKIGNATVKQR